jgi:hypothetical protein
LILIGIQGLNRQLLNFTVMATFRKAASLWMIRHVKTAQYIPGPFSDNGLLANHQNTFRNVVYRPDTAVSINHDQAAGKGVHQCTGEAVIK